MPKGTFQYPTRRPNRLAAESSGGRTVCKPNKLLTPLLIQPVYCLYLRLRFVYV